MSGCEVRPPEYIVDNETGCWVWQGPIGADGYGRKYADGKCVLARRWYYELDAGEIEAGLFISPTCRNPACVNPDHMKAITASEKAALRWSREKCDTSSDRRHIGVTDSHSV